MIIKEVRMKNNLFNIKSLLSCIVSGLIGLIIFLPSCTTTPPPTNVVNPNPKEKVIEVKKIEPVTAIEVLELPFSSKWNPEYYKKYNETNYDRFPDFKKRLDFAKIDYPLLNAAVFYETNLRRKENDLFLVQNS